MPGEIWAYKLDSTKNGLDAGHQVQVGQFGFLLSDSPFHDGLVMNLDTRTLLTGGVEDFLQLSHQLPDNMSAGALRSLLQSVVQAAPAGSVDGHAATLSAAAEGHAGTLSVAGEHMVVALDVMQAFAGEKLHDAGFDGLVFGEQTHFNASLDPLHIVLA